MIYLFSLCVLLLGCYFYFYARYWHAPVVLVICYLTVWGFSVYMMGRPRPVTHDYLVTFKETVVLYYVLKEPEAIYLWLQFDEPIAYKLPWNTRMAQQLYAASESAKKSRGKLKVENLGNMFNPGDWVFHAEPPPALPPKMPY